MEHLKKQEWLVGQLASVVEQQAEALRALKTEGGVAMLDGEDSEAEEDGVAGVSCSCFSTISTADEDEELKEEDEAQKRDAEASENKLSDEPPDASEKSEADQTWQDQEPTESEEVAVPCA